MPGGSFPSYDRLWSLYPNDGLASQRFFTNDMNGRLMIVGRATGLFSTYLDFDSIFNGVDTAIVTPIQATRRAS